MFIKVFWTHISCNTEKFIQTKATETETVNRFNQPQRGNALS